MILTDSIQQFDAVEVTWLDTEHHGGWTRLEAALMKCEKSDQEYRSVGFFLALTERYLAICQDRGEDDGEGPPIGEVQQFPIGVVRIVRRLAQK